MKFAHDFKDILASQDFPSHWVKQAIPYCQLKKCLKKIQRELQDLGLDSDTLRALLDHNNASPVALRYKLKAASDSSLVRPKLMVHIHVQDGVAVEAPLTPTSLRFFQRIATVRDPCIPLSEPVSSYPRSHFALVYDLPDSEPTQRTDTLPMPASFLSGVACETIEIPLVFDSEFFGLLQGDVNNLDALQAEEVKNMAAEVVELGKEVSQVSQPTRFAKSDLARWRYIFELYLDAEVFFATNEHDHGARSSQRALEQLQWFQNEVDKRYLARNFKLGESKLAFSKFLKLNACLLKNLQFQEINRTAVFKILKKFDKRTSFGVSQAFTAVIQSDGLFSRNIAKDVCAQMSQDLVSVVPQLNDYLCPICCSVAYRPVRLSCKHVFCIRCVVKIQRFQEKHCPLCRADVVMDASADNLDHKLEKYMKRYFPKEVKEKQRANEIERGIEDYGPGYTHQQCLVM